MLVRFSKNDQSILAQSTHKHKQLQTHTNKIQSTTLKQIIKQLEYIN